MTHEESATSQSIDVPAAAIKAGGELRLQRNDRLVALLQRDETDTIGDWLRDVFSCRQAWKTCTGGLVNADTHGHDKSV